MLIALVVVTAAAGCSNDPSAHAYLAQRFDPLHRCLEEKASAIDVVEGKPARTNCAAKCFLAKADEAGARDAHVSTMCPPYPPQMESNELDPTCREALAALARGDTCLSDGGSTHPTAPDAGAADAGGD